MNPALGVSIRILAYNWRDICNPSAGGAEVYTHQILHRLVNSGHEATVFTSAFKGCQAEEIIDGVKYVRNGGRLSVYSKAKRFYHRFGDAYDLVIDEINTVPFMTPKFVEHSKIVALIHQLAREFWFYETPYPVAWIGYRFLEHRWLRLYRSIPTITVSSSTKIELEELGFRRVSVVHNGLNTIPRKSVPEKSLEPTIVFVGRMKKAKKPGDVVEAFNVLKQKHPTLHLTMVGDGYCRESLMNENRDVEFVGYVPRDTRDELVKRAWVIAVPGVREGWGQVVTDANALGTPAVGYDIPGLRDSIIDGHSGILVKPNPTSLAAGLDSILSDNQMRRDMTSKALEWSRSFDWDRSAREFEAAILRR